MELGDFFIKFAVLFYKRSELVCQSFLIVLFSSHAVQTFRHIRISLDANFHYAPNNRSIAMPIWLAMRGVEELGLIFDERDNLWHTDRIFKWQKGTVE